jgi:hypothetical protein
VEYFKYRGSTIKKKGARYTHEITSTIAMAKAASNPQQADFTSKLDLNLRKKLTKCYIWSIVLCGTET